VHGGLLGAEAEAFVTDWQIFTSLLEGALLLLLCVRACVRACAGGAHSSRVSRVYGERESVSRAFGRAGGRACRYCFVLFFRPWPGWVSQTLAAGGVFLLPSRCRGGRRPAMYGLASLCFLAGGGRHSLFACVCPTCTGVLRAALVVAVGGALRAFFVAAADPRIAWEWTGEGEFGSTLSMVVTAAAAAAPGQRLLMRRDFSLRRNHSNGALTMQSRLTLFVR
jgi:hypothetical protein